MRKFILAACLIMTALAAAADAQLFTSETTRQAGEKRVEEAKKLRGQQPQ